MYKIYSSDDKAEYEISELAKMFAMDDEFVIERDDKALSKNEQKRNAYKLLSKETGKTLDWGILTGVRPHKLYASLAKEKGVELANRIMKDEYYLSDEKINLLNKVFRLQEDVLYNTDRKAIGLYIGIPFCPTRCSYCSFTSNKYTADKADEYLKALEKEIVAVSKILESKGLFAESIYIGGGTPTALNDEQFEKLLTLTEEYFIEDRTKEFTVECGRPDTINKNKLLSVSRHHAGRISINPQSMNQKTLDAIGRLHSPEAITSAYQLARETGDFIINMDMIAGLPGEDKDDFKYSLDKIIDLNPENITVHTLAVKRASRLIEEDKYYAVRQAGVVREMLAYASAALDINKYQPYYLYRQKHMAGNFENVGYCKDNKASIYNIRIMEENQTIVALGAGGISKVYYPDENRLERVPNVSNYEVYIERIDEMIQRKENGIDG